MIQQLDQATLHLPSLQQMAERAKLLWQRAPRLPASEGRRDLSSFQRAVQRAYRRFARQHPRWANSLFDDYFLTQQAAPTLLAIYRNERWPTAYELSLAWFAQFETRMGENIYDRIYPAMGAAATFLDLLREEWANPAPLH